MKKLLVSIYKEGILLIRDIEGVALLFIMPLALVIVLTLLQHRTFQNILESKIKVVVIDFDGDELGKHFREGIMKSNIFEVTAQIGDDSSLLEHARRNVAKGKYQIGIYIPENTTQKIKARAVAIVRQQLPFSISTQSKTKDEQAVIKLFFDPITKTSFQNLTKSKLVEFASQTETRIIFETYSKVIDAMTNQVTNVKYPEKPILSFDVDMVSEYTAGILPNSVQHNVPAWALFGMFLICIPIAGNIIKERTDGCMARLKTIPVSYFTIISGKSVIFVIICLIQALLILVVGIYIMPLLSLPRLQIGDNWLALLLISIASALAATGYGIVIGNVASTQIQASTFGSVSTVILAAVGGVWVPVTVMPPMMRKISEISPMNWGIQGYYDVLLRHSNSLEILPEVVKLIVFYIICTIISILFRKFISTNQ
ncbi:MAG: ABC transporter permease [Bacteroidales bacterium]|nr:ABC transporter permease [Bacteroidales bacterium]